MSTRIHICNRELNGEKPAREKSDNPVRYARPLSNDLQRAHLCGKSNIRANYRCYRSALAMKRVTLKQDAFGDGAITQLDVPSPSKDSQHKSFRTRLLVTLISRRTIILAIVGMCVLAALSMDQIAGDGTLAINRLIQQRFALLRGGVAKKNPHAIPRIIHQTWKNDMVTATSASRIKSWLRHNPDWEYKFWTNDDGRRFMVRYCAEITFCFLRLDVGSCNNGIGAALPRALTHVQRL